MKYPEGNVLGILVPQEAVGGQAHGATLSIPYTVQQHSNGNVQGYPLRNLLRSTVEGLIDGDQLVTLFEGNATTIKFYIYVSIRIVIPMVLTDTCLPSGPDIRCG